MTRKNYDMALKKNQIKFKSERLIYLAKKYDKTKRIFEDDNMSCTPFLSFEQIQHFHNDRQSCVFYAYVRVNSRMNWKMGTYASFSTLLSSLLYPIL